MLRPRMTPTRFKGRMTKQQMHITETWASVKIKGVIGLIMVAGGRQRLNYGGRMEMEG